MKPIIALIFSLVVTTGFAAPNSKAQVIELQVTEKGFEPSTIDIKPGTFVVLKVTRKTDTTCATAIQIPARKVKKDLPLNQTVRIDLGKLVKGEIRFACGMDMLSGKLIVR
jgi:plastocyanin domain-containing protein